MSAHDTVASLRHELTELRERLAEADDMLRALRQGEVDALVVQTPGGERVYSLAGADQAYRTLVETMNEGTVTVLASPGHPIYYCNKRFGEMMGLPLESLIGARFDTLLVPEDALCLDKWQDFDPGYTQCENVSLCGSDGARIPVRLSASTLILEDEDALCVIVSDLRAQKRNDALVKEGQLASAILRQAADAIVVCTNEGEIVRANESAQSLCDMALAGRRFDDVFAFSEGAASLHGAGPEDFAVWIKGVCSSPQGEARYTRPNGEVFFLQVNANELYGDEGAFGFVISMINVTERKHAENDLRTLTEQLKEADQRKNEFLAMLAHELRNPLAPIRNAVEILQTSSVSAPDWDKARDIIERQVLHLARLVNDLLDVSRVTEGKVLLQRSPVDLAIVAYAGVELARPVIDIRGHRLTLTLPPPGELWVEGDATRLAQVIGNLLNNAAKYTDPGGTITLSASVEQRDVVLRVRDTGVGIAPELLPRIFELFAQGERSIDRAQGGLGIGLALVKSMVNLHGGTVTGQSEGYGCGSTFVVRLPLIDAPAPRSHAVRASGQAILKRILVVDDNVDAAESMMILLQLDGHTVRCAHEGHAGLAVAAELRPDICLLDVGLPGMDGYALVQRLQAAPEMSGVLYVALTGYGQEEDKQHALEVGFHHHLTKPVEFEQLRAIINATPAKRNAERDARPVDRLARQSRASINGPN